MGNAIRDVCVSSIGDFFISAGANKTLRFYSQTKNQTFALEIKRKIEEEKMIEEDMFKNENLEKDAIKKKYENVKTAEYFMDLIENIEKESKDKQTNYENFVILKKRSPRPDFPEL